MPNPLRALSLLSVLGLGLATVGCQAFASGSATPNSKLRTQKKPSISAITPDSSAQGNLTVNVTVSGANFTGQAQMQWNGSGRSTTVLSTQQLVGTILAADLSTAGTAQVSVKDLRTGAVSNTAAFAVVAQTSTPSSTLSVTTSSLPNGVIGQAYSAAAIASGGTPPYTWSVSNGTLPASLSLAATTGTLSGTPSAGGSDQFTLQVRDSAGGTASKVFTVSIASNSLDQYGGRTDLGCSAATGYFHVEKVNNNWWFCTPEGHAYFMVGMYNMLVDTHVTDLGTIYASIAKAKYGNYDTIWGPAQVRRIKSWGFNGVAEFSVKWVLPTTTCYQCPGGWSGANYSQPYPVPMTAQIQPSMYALSNQNGYAPGPVKDIQSGIKPSVVTGIANWNSTFPDIWDNNFYAWIDGEMRNDPNIASAINSPWVLGWISDECDALFGLCGAGPEMATNPGGYNQRHQAVMTLVTSPQQNANPGRNMVRSQQVYSDPTAYSKAQLLSYLQSKYAGIAALNSAWGSNYTQWESTGTQKTAESLGVGDGSTKTFSKTLPNIDISPLSVAVKIDGTKVGGDCPAFLCGSDTFTGSAKISSGSISYSNGAVSVTFAMAPPSGAAITLDYVSGGWGIGTGLMDEDGHNSWIPRNVVYLTGATSAFTADMDGFLEVLATQYFSVTKDRIKAYATNNMYFGPGVLGTWSGVANHNVLRAAANYVDVLTWKPDDARLQSQLDYVAQHLGDKPALLWHGTKSEGDSALWRYIHPSDTQCNPCNTQEERGAYYASSMNAFLNTRNTLYGSRPIIGIRWWAYTDMWAEGNWGMVSLQDNAYDGVEACSTSTTDPFGYTTYPEENIPTWTPGASYAVPSGVPASGIKGNRVQAVAPDGNRYEYEVTAPGTSGSTAPPWPTIEGTTVTDGGVTWKNIGRKKSATCYGDILTQVKSANARWLEIK